MVGSPDIETPDKHRRPTVRLIPSYSFHQLSRSDRMKLWAKRYRTEISASSASLLSTITAFPLDTVKTRLQSYKYKNFWDCVKDGYRTEGVKGFWRGVWSPLMSITLVRTVSFSIYQQAKYTADDIIDRTTGTSPLIIANTRGAYPNWSTVLCFGAAGAAAGAAIVPIACPFELTKNAQQLAEVMVNRPRIPGMDKELAGSYQKKGTFATARQLVKHRGFLGLYSGFNYHLLRDTIGTGVYFMTYESVKQILANARGENPASPEAVVLAGGACGLVSWACIFPIDTAKTRYQRNCLMSHKDQTKLSPIRFFDRRMYRGLAVSMARSCVINAIFFSTFEFMKKRINQLEVDHIKI